MMDYNVDQFISPSFDFIGAQKHIHDQIFDHLISTKHVNTPLDVLDSIVRVPSNNYSQSAVLSAYNVVMTVENFYKLFKAALTPARSITPVSSTSYQSLPVYEDKAVQTDPVSNIDYRDPYIMDTDDENIINNISSGSKVPFRMDPDIEKYYTYDSSDGEFNNPISDDEYMATDLEIAQYLNIKEPEVLKLSAQDRKREKVHKKRNRINEDNINTNDEQFVLETTIDDSELNLIDNVDSFFPQDKYFNKQTEINAVHNPQIHQHNKKFHKRMKECCSIFRDGYRSFSLHIVYRVNVSQQTISRFVKNFRSYLKRIFRSFTNININNSFFNVTYNSIDNNYYFLEFKIFFNTTDEMVVDLNLKMFFVKLLDIKIRIKSLAFTKHKWEYKISDLPDYDKSVFCGN